jgi:hypothetical protein
MVNKSPQAQASPPGTGTVLLGKYTPAYGLRGWGSVEEAEEA